ncbi:MAG: hypothetical protein ABR540_11010 [Acidimicrobiales bacterium]
MGSIGLGLATLAALVVTQGLVPGIALPSYVARVTIVNPTDYPVQVAVAGAEREGWLDLGEVTAGSSRTVEEVIDQGGHWAFRFQRAQLGHGEVVLSRQELRRDRWRVTVPARLLEYVGRQAAPIPRSPELDEVDAAP